MTDKRESVWNAPVDASAYGDEKTYRQAVLEQYKLYVEMTDRISQRRGLTNTFFLTLNTGIVASVGVFWKDRPAPGATLAVALVAVLIGCGAWFSILRTYRQLNRTRWDVVYALEERLPASPYGLEWDRLGNGTDLRRYTPFTYVERWIPVLFALTYAAGFLAAVVSG